MTEIAEGRYIVVQEPPLIVSALGAIPKPNGGVRLIHDCSRPPGCAVNDHAHITSRISYQTIKHATQLISQGDYLSKIDLKDAYRSVLINPNHYPCTGLKWKFKGDSEYTYMCDTRLPFGARLSVECFHRLSLALQRILLKKGIKTVVYLDDILIVSETKEKCASDMSIAIATIRSLGFGISYHKVEGPSTALTFLGIQIDTADCTLKLPLDKAQAFKQLLHQFRTKRRASLKQLQRLAGKLQWATHVVRGGRIYLQRVLATMRKLAKPSHKVVLSSEFHADIDWWLHFMDRFNGKRFNFKHTFSHHIATDASLTGGGAILDHGADWNYLNWAVDMPQFARGHINEKETVAVTAAVHRWAPYLADSDVTVVTDNICTMAAINKGACHSQHVMMHIRSLFWLANMFNFTLRCTHVPGKDNILCDSLSRLDQRGHNLFWFSLASNHQPYNDFNLRLTYQGHMSHQSLMSLMSQDHDTHRSSTNSIS